MIFFATALNMITSALALGGLVLASGTGVVVAQTRCEILHTDRWRRR